MESMNIQLLKATKAYDNSDFALAYELLQPLCDNDIPEALSMLGVMYQLGDGVERDGLKAVTYLERAVELGQGVAAHNLGTIYTTGLPGVEADKSQSMSYYKKAKAMGAQFAPNEFYK